MFIYTEWNAWWNSVGIYSTQVIAFINYKCFIKTYWNVLIVITKYFAFFSPKKVNSPQLQNFTFSTAWEIKTSFKRLIFVDIFLCTYIVVSMSFVSCTYLTRNNLIACPCRMQVHLPLPQTGSSIPLPDGLACCPKDLLSLLAGIKFPSANSRRSLSLFCKCGYQ